MDIGKIKESLNRRMAGGIDFYKRRPGKYQLIVPILHEDGDMVDIYLRESPLGEGYIRICDFGMTLMRLSYTFEISTPTRQDIFESILINNQVDDDDGNLYMDTTVDQLYEGILQFAGCVQKVCNMRYWSREIVRSAFYDDLKEHVKTELMEFSPEPDRSPLPDHPLLSVDWSLVHNRQNFYLFGVRGNDKAKNVAISLLEFQKVRLPFISLVVHENMQELGMRESSHLTRNADKQYSELDIFKQSGYEDIHRLAGVMRNGKSS